MRVAATLAAAAAASLALSPAPSAWAGRTVEFSFEDGRYLAAGETNGGAIFVPDGVDAEALSPLVVLLHGTNERGPLHRWLRGDAGRDLRPVVQRLVDADGVPPMLLAAPSQTRGASSGRKLWEGFDLSAFVDAVEHAADGLARVDRDRVVVVGHSGAGCNPNGGLLRAASVPGDVVPIGIVAADVCMDVEAAELLAHAPDTTDVSVFWQPVSWPRDFDAFVTAFEAASPAGAPRHAERLDDLGDDPHDAALVEAFVRSTRRLLHP